MFIDLFIHTINMALPLGSGMYSPRQLRVRRPVLASQHANSSMCWCDIVACTESMHKCFTGSSKHCCRPTYTNLCAVLLVPQCQSAQIKKTQTLGLRRAQLDAKIDSKAPCVWMKRNR